VPSWNRRKKQRANPKPGKNELFLKALRYSFPVLLGYFTIGSAFGLLVADAGYPWWLTLAMSLFMFAGAGQFIAVGLFAAGTTLWEAALVQLVVNARHMAYGLSMMKHFRDSGPFKPYLIFGLSDETFALLSSLPENEDPHERTRFMFLVTLLDQSYWVAGSMVGTIAGSLIPFNIEGISYALTALFIVLMIEQIYRVRRPGIFIASAILAVLCVMIIPSRVSLLGAMAFSLAISSVLSKTNLPEANPPQTENSNRENRG
jgi:4-azaleucine resistance transporter AzlC